MRLTLRNMLAYMDNLLDSENRQEIGERIEESERATNLLHHIRDCMRRLRLGAPELMDRKHGLDPNTVAEYLDNTLADDRVTDFEKVCLDSDVHLAEVAACHQILTLVLGEPAEVNPESRVRMYHLPEVMSRRVPLESDSVSEILGDLRLDTDDEPDAHQSKPTVPAYLRKTRRQRLAPIAVAVMVVLLAVAAYLTATDRLRLDALFGGPGSLFGSPEPAQSETDLVLETPDPAVPRPDNTSESAGQEEPSERNTPAVPEQPARVDAAKPAPGELARPPVDAVVAVVPRHTTPVLPNVGNTGELPVAPPGEAPAAGEPIGQLLTVDEPMVKLDRTTGQWQRLTLQVPILADEVLVGWPAFRPVVCLAEQLLVQPVDGCRFRAYGPDERGVVALTVESGQMVLRPADDIQQTSVRLRIASTDGILTLADPTTLVAVRVARLPNGNLNPETQPGEVETDLYVISGRAFWHSSTMSEPISLDPPTQLSLSGQPAAARPLKGIPDWIQHDLNSLLDQRASLSFSRLLDPRRPVVLTLRELAGHRQKEVRWLALRSLGWIGDFDPMAEALNVADYRVEWPDVIEHLRTAIARGPNDAAAVRAAMEHRYGPDGTALYEMLWQYSTEKIEPADAASLVEWLDDDMLALRVLAFWNLKRITGLGFFYRPEYTAAKRRQSVQRWRARLLSSPTLGGST